MKIKKKLEKYHQNHLLQFVNELDETPKKEFINQLKNIKFKKIKKIYTNSYKNENVKMKKISPLDYFDKKEINKEYYKNIGLQFLNNYGLITLGGGSGTRLGYDLPKGTYVLKMKHENISIFGLIAKELLKIKNEYQIEIPWYILTSQENKQITIDFFKDNNYFSYNKEKIIFFSQESMPILDVNGNLLLKNKNVILQASNGNGEVFKALRQNQILKHMLKSNIKYIQISNVDNILCKVFDPIFLGLMSEKKFKVGVKSFFKQPADSKEFVFCKYKNKPFMLNYQFINSEFSSQKKNNRFLYRDTFSGISIFSMDAILKLSKKELPYHRAYKNYKYINIEGQLINQEEENAFKFEKYIFDSFNYFNDMLVYRVDQETEFAPIKNKTGDNSPEQAIEKYEKVMSVKSNNKRS